MKPKTSLVIDTDAGTDPDDLFALTYAIKNPNADLQAITIVHGNLEIRGKIVKKLERILGADIPITIGEKCSEEMIKKYWCGFEHLALTPKEIKEPLKKQEFPEYNSDTNLACMGPLTNIALQLEKNPSIKNVKNIYVMGSFPTSHNFIIDREATKKVFEQPWNIFQITKQVSKKIYFTIEELENFRESKLGNFLYDSTVRWFDYTKKTEAPMYDVLTVSSALGENFVKFKQETDNRFVSYDVDPKLKDRIVEMIKS